MNHPEIRMVPVDALVPYARNARTHSDAQVAQIAASITEFGWTNPILTDGAKGLIAGHGRLMAARNGAPSSGWARPSARLAVRKPIFMPVS